jgi:NO-binding membrane sensor protein with MHYT domain/anti-sigma regulatory factor (Ser/Thr protein kinase)
MGFPASIDTGLLAISLAIGLTASYGAFEIVDRARASRGTSQIVWIISGALAMGIAFWAMQYIGMLAYGLPQATQLYAVLTALSRLVAIAVAGSAIVIAALNPLDRTTRILGSLLLGPGIVLAHLIGIAATATHAAHVEVSWPFTVLTLAIAVTDVALCFALIKRLREVHGPAAFGLRVIAALTLSLGIGAIHLSGMLSLRISYEGAQRVPVGFNQYLIAAVATVALLLSIAAIVAARFDRLISGERARSAKLQDLYTRERRTALALQRALLPSSLPVVEGLTFSWSYVPSSAEAGVGGDWFDAFSLDDGRVALSIGDAVGHDTTAVIAMNVVRQALRSAAVDRSDPAAVLSHANRVLFKSGDVSLVTAIFGVLDPTTLAFEYACAGHPPPIAATAEGEAKMLPGVGSGVPLGLFDDAVVPTQRVQLAPGGMLALFTDGVIERERDAIEGITVFERAVGAIALAGTPDAARVLDRTILGEGERADDAAIMTISLAPVLAALDLRLPATPPSVPQARVAMRRFIAGLGISEDLGYAMLVASGEAFSNAVEHAYADHLEPAGVMLRAHRLGAQVEIVVEDHGRWRPGHNDSDRGRGVEIMRALASSLEIDDAPTGTRLRLRFALTEPSLPYAQAGT